jgi:hypothetical protein
MAGLCPVVERRNVFQKHGTNPGSQRVEIETGKTHRLVFFPFNDDAIESLFVRRQLPLTVSRWSQGCERIGLTRLFDAAPSVAVQFGASTLSMRRFPVARGAPASSDAIRRAVGRRQLTARFLLRHCAARWTSVLSISLMRPDIGRYSTPSQGMLPQSASESKSSREITLVKRTWSFSAIRAGMVSPSWDGRGDRGDGDRARDSEARFPSVVESGELPCACATTLLCGSSQAGQRINWTRVELATHEKARDCAACPIGSSAPTTASWGPSLNKLSFYLVALGNTRGSLASFFSLLQIRLGKRYHMLFRFTFLH